MMNPDFRTASSAAYPDQTLRQRVRLAYNNAASYATIALMTGAVYLLFATASDRRQAALDFIERVEARVVSQEIRHEAEIRGVKAKLERVAQAAAPPSTPPPIVVTIPAPAERPPAAKQREAVAPIPIPRS